jgi:hypothetical protein
LPLYRVVMKAKVGSVSTRKVNALVVTLGTQSNISRAKMK